MDKTYDPHQVEKRWYERWEQEGYFIPREGADPYCIMIPPPNVTGTLHMGHAFQDTIMDALIRYHRMNGRTTLWQPGTDHAGIATQMVVERQLDVGPTESRHDLGRETRSSSGSGRWKEESGGHDHHVSCAEWGPRWIGARERFTMDDWPLAPRCTEVFVRLFEEGLIYRGKRLVNWDPVLHTAISDLEVISEEETRVSSGTCAILWPTARGHLVVATTRPETMLGDTAVAVHPDRRALSARSIGSIGRCCRLAERRIPDRRRRLWSTPSSVPAACKDHTGPRLQ